MKNKILYLIYPLMLLVGCAAEEYLEVPTPNPLFSNIDAVFGDDADRKVSPYQEVMEQVIGTDLLVYSFGDGRYTVKIPERWIMFNIQGEELNTAYANGGDFMAEYVGYQELAELIMDFDIQKMRTSGVQLFGYFDQDVYLNPKTSMNVLIEPRPEGFDFHLVPNNFYNQIVDVVGDENIVIRKSPDGQNYEVLYAIVVNDIEMGFDFYFLNFGDEIVTIAFSGEPIRVVNYNTAFGKIASSVVDLNTKGE